MNMYYMIRMCEVAVQAEASRLELEAATAELWEMSCKQYEAFAKTSALFSTVSAKGESQVVDEVQSGHLRYR